MKKDQLVVRHNNLIEAHYSTSLVQQRLLYWLIAQIRPTDRQLQTYRITIKGMGNFLGLKNNNLYREVREAAEGMVGNVVRIKDIKRERTLTASLVSSVEYHHGRGYIDISLDPKLRPYLLNLQDSFTRAYLGELSAVGGVYATRIFDLLIQYRRIGKRTCTIDELRAMLNLGSKYKLYSNFKNRVIIPAVAEINRSTNFKVTWEEAKKGRAVHTIVFTFNEVAPSLASPEEASPTNHDDLVHRIMSHGLSKRVSQKFVTQYADTDVDRILDALGKVEEGIRTGKISNPGGYLRRAIEEDWREQPSLFMRSLEDEKKRVADQVAKQRRRDQQIHAIDEQINDLERRYLKAREEFIADIIRGLTDTEYQTCLETMKDQFGSDPRVGLWSTTGNKGDLSSRTILPLVEQMFSEMFNQDFDDLEAFLAKEGLTSIEELRSEREQYL